MRKLILFISSLLFVHVCYATQPPANTYQQQVKVQEILLQAFSYITNNGKEAALKTFNDSDSAFYKKYDGLYVFAFQSSGKDAGLQLASGYEKENIGKNRYAEKNNMGQYIIRDLIKGAQQGGGWVHYQYMNPKTNKLEDKWTYVISVNKDWFIGSGFYTNANN